MDKNRTSRVLVGSAAALMALCLAGAPEPVSADTSSGDLDTTYGVGGIDDLGTEGGGDEYIGGSARRGLVSQGNTSSRAEFRVFLARTGNNSTPWGVSVGRLDGDGALDSSFAGGDGTWTHRGEPTSMAVDGQDRIYICGDFRDTNGNWIGGLVRLSADGVLDTTYGSNGYVTDRSYSDFDVASSGAAYVGARVTSKGKGRWAVERLTTSGSADSSFGKRGAWTSSFQVSDSGPDGLRMDSEGSLLLWGEPSSSLGPVVVRLTGGGSLDTTFGVVASSSSAVTASAKKGGGGGNGGGGNGGGGGDDSGGDGGMIALPVGIQTLLPGDNGEFYLSGTVHFDGNATNPRDPFVARYDGDGIADSSFGNGSGSLVGFAYPDLAGSQYGHTIAREDGRIVQAGTAGDGSAPLTADVQVFAYEEIDGDMDATFGTDGASELGDTTYGDVTHQITIDVNGDVLVAGYTRGTSSAAPRWLLIARYCW